MIPRARQFTHLHLHSEYSLLDGGNRIDKLVKRVKALGMNSVAVTDHGNLFGAMSFYWTAKAEGVKPILGCEAYVAPNHRTDKTYTGVQDGGFHLVLLAENNAGWKNLLYLASEAYLTGFYYKPRIDKELLTAHADGLIAINGHLGSELAHHLVEYDKTKDKAHWQKAVECAQWHAQTFKPSPEGLPRFFVELQRHVPEQEAINPHLKRLARELDLPLVCDNDSHFLLEEDWDAHDSLCCISMGKIKSDESRLKYPKQLFVKSPEQMRELFADCPEAVDNSVAIAERCNVDIELGNHAPVVRVVRPKKPLAYNGEADLTAWFKKYCADFTLEPFDSTAATDENEAAHLEKECDDTLRDLAHAGLIWRYGPGVLNDEDDDTRSADEKRAIRARLERELKILADKSISAYFLIVWDFVNWGRQRGVPAMARGSGVGTMVGYVLGLSNACPVKYGLLFERFTDPNRSEYPDIDIDLCQDRRADVINYVREKYGHVAQIITFGTLKARAAIRDIGRVMDIPLPEVDKIAKLVPEGLKVTIDTALEQEPDLKAMYDSEGRTRQLLDTARTLEGQVRHASVHAAGVIVATRPLHEIVPLYKAPGSDDIVTQWDGPTCEKVGLLKMDFLGLRTLSVVERAKQLIRQTLSEDQVRKAVGWSKDRAGDPLDLDRLAFNDPRVFECFRRADTTGVFQFESGGMRRLLAEMKPDRLEDLIAANALFRPGPMDLIPTYNRRKHGQEDVPKVHPIVDRFTAETYGVMVYQEQVMQICHELGGIALRDAYSLIKAISKKKQKTIDAAKPDFIKGAEQRGMARRDAEELFDLILKFAGYGFNKSHSTAYAITAYHTAYLKTYFPNQYMAAFLTYESQALKVDEWIRYLDDCRKTVFPDSVDGSHVGVEVRPPDINLSQADFSVVFDPDEPRDNCHGHVRFGLRALKGAGSRAIDSIIAERESAGEFKSLHEFCERVPSGSVNKATIESLVCSGAFDSVHGREKRANMKATIESAVAAGQSLARDRAAGQNALFGGGDEPAEAPAPPLINCPEWSEKELLQREKDTLGFYLSSHPLVQHGEKLEHFATATTTTLRDMKQDERHVVGGLVKSVRIIIVRNGKSAGSKMAIVTFEDRAGTVEAVLFTDCYAKYGEMIAEDAVLLMMGKVDHSRGDAQLIVDKVADLETAASELGRRIEVSIDERSLNGTSEKTLRALRDAVNPHINRPSSAAGADAKPLKPTPLQIVLRTSEGKKITLESVECRVCPSDELLRSLSATVGNHNVKLVTDTSPGIEHRPRYPRAKREPAHA
ncbi:MAG: DNA polymerase III subunit alpha [Phycisphaerales bacterium]